MTDFFPKLARARNQDGAGSGPTSCSGETGGEGEPARVRGRHLQAQARTHFCSPTSSTSISPVKSRPRWNTEHNQHTEVSLSRTPSIGSTALENSIAAFPTTNQPVLETTLKKMLVFLQSSIHADIFKLDHQFKADIHLLDDQVLHLECKMGEFTYNFNELVDAHSEREKYMEWMKAKLADLEDRSRRNKIKIKGIPQSVKPVALKDFFTKLMSDLLLEAPPSELLLDHNLPDNV